MTPKKTESHQLLTTAEVAERWRVTPQSVVRMCWHGDFPNAFQVARRTWRIPIEDVEAHEKRGRR